jgi:hypothetical protein
MPFLNLGGTVLNTDYSVKLDIQDPDADLAIPYVPYTWILVGRKSADFASSAEHAPTYLRQSTFVFLPSKVQLWGTHAMTEFVPT